MPTLIVLNALFFAEVVENEHVTALEKQSCMSVYVGKFVFCKYLHMFYQRNSNNCVSRRK